MRPVILSIAALLIVVALFSAARSPAPSAPPAEAGAGTEYVCVAKPGKDIFKESRNPGGHPELWEDVTEIRKTLGPLQPDGTRTIKIEFTTPDGTVTINDTLDASGRFEGEAPVTYSGFATNVEYKGKVSYDFQDPDKPRKESGRWKVGADLNLPGNKAITFREYCLFEPRPTEDGDADGVAETANGTSTFTSQGPFTLNPGTASYLVTLSNGQEITIPMVNVQGFTVEPSRETQGDWRFYRGHSIDATFLAEFTTANTSFTFHLPDELGGGDITAPVEGSILWTVIMNDAATQVLDMEIDVDIFGSDFTFNSGSASTDDWSWTYNPEVEPVGTLNLATGAYELTVGALLDDDNLRVNTATQQGVPLSFTGTITGNFSPFAQAAMVVDNCPDDANPDQADEDEDGVGNVCDNAFADFDCDGDTDPDDALKQLLSLQNLPIEQEADCPAPDTPVDFDGFSVTWGNIDCSAVRDPQDALKTLMVFVGLEVEQEPDCPQLS